MSKFIVEKRKYFLILFSIITILSIVGAFKVKTNYDLSNYLPEDSATLKGMEILNNNFGSEGYLEVMINNISKEESVNLKTKLNSVTGISDVNFDENNEKYFKDNKALYKISLSSNNYSNETPLVIENIKNNIAEYETYMNGGSINNKILKETLSNEIPIISVVAVAIILVILLLTSTSYLEPLIFLFTTGIAIIINYGTNIIFNNISFVTGSIGSILQLALSIDYSIMLLHRYHEEKKFTSDIKTAMINTLNKTYKSIFSSALTTIFGLLAMVFMSFAIGRDLGLVLAKGVLFSALTAFFLLPGIIIWLDKLLEKTKKKPIKFGGKFISIITNKYKILITIITVVLILFSFFESRKLELNYSIKFFNSDEKMIVDNFGVNNQMVILFPKDTSLDNQRLFLSQLNDLNQDKKFINETFAWTNTVALKLSPQEVSEMLKIDTNVINNIFNMYYIKKGIEKGSSVEIIDLIDFITVETQTNTAFKLPDEILGKLIYVNQEFNGADKKFNGADYSRIIVYTNLGIEGEKEFDIYDDIKSISTKIFGDNSYIVSEITTAYDTKKTVSAELDMITIITIISVFTIILLTFKKLSLPTVLVTIIQGAIYLSMSVSALSNKPIYFLALIITQCIQMGATIDYAILWTSNYNMSRKNHNKKDAILESYKISGPTILTSASILIVATLAVNLISKQEILTSVCGVIARGTLLSTILVICALPSIIILIDRNKNLH